MPLNKIYLRHRLQVGKIPQDMVLIITLFLGVHLNEIYLGHRLQLDKILQDTVLAAFHISDQLGKML